MTGLPLVLVAHGSRNPAAASVAGGIAAAVALREPDLDVRVCFVDVHGPTVEETVADLPGAVVVPAFLAAGYHVRVDLPARLAACGAGHFPLTAALGVAAGTPGTEPDPSVLAAAWARLADAGHEPGDAVVLAAAGSSDARAVAQVRGAARALGAAAGRRVRVGFAATGAPEVSALVEALRRAGERRVAVASWLLAPGVFADRLRRSGAEVVAEPLGVHEHVVDAVVRRYRSVAGVVRDVA
ncbi:sirohydrochlorin chelatase [Pseudonocardia endophytica]|uniref:Sirohydrochlorin ferrochelatase n=1 Tax=Pseudonocardia endophytica TaxID=401976 RepID=A0A4R1HZ37_PSEEN|nr:CbiX/SirB N-terminal domain-containing protein [Pseudonocardia endophytica]TCK26455.1 sirohydrochlorin ferrochelatase [Pseudonocardia endophytica]